MNELALFAGAGGGILGAHLLGWRTVCAVEINEYCRRVLIARQNEGCLRPFPIWDDIRTFDGRPWAGIVDVVTGGFPCQDISCAGKGAGITGERSGLWSEMSRVIGEVGPRFVLVENSPMLTGRGLGVVLGDLAKMGFDARWGVLGAHHAGAPHKRDRIWIAANTSGGRCRQSVGREIQQPRGAQAFGSSEIVANADGSGRERSGSLQSARRFDSTELAGPSEAVPHADSPGLAQRKGVSEDDGEELQAAERGGGKWWRKDPADNPKSGVGRVAHGVANRVDRIRALGNGQIPAVVRIAWKTLSI